MLAIRQVVTRRVPPLGWLRALSTSTGTLFTSALQLDLPEDCKPRAVFRLLSVDGEMTPGIAVDKEEALKLYTNMVRLAAMDKVFFDAQRQGRISFYMTSMGEEAAVIGSAAGLKPSDEVFAQYREQGVLMWRGFGLQRFADQLFGNADDLGKGRQMPVHYGSKDLHFQTISSPLATQIPQSVGAAYGFKLAKNNRVVACYFGDGATSEGDFHAGMNFASTLGCPVVFICRNNGYAISTPAREQYHSVDGIAARARGYGMASIRVDGNDVFAVKEATEQAREYSVKRMSPILLEILTYRVGHHSTSDDSTRYRSIDEIEEWRVKNNPINRLYLFLEKQGWLTSDQDKEMKEVERANVLDALMKAERKPKLNAITAMFEDVYDEIPKNLVEQREALRKHLERYPPQDDGHH